VSGRVTLDTEAPDTLEARGAVVSAGDS